MASFEEKVCDDLQLSTLSYGAQVLCGIVNIMPSTLMYVTAFYADQWLSKKHAGFIVNVDHATATDYQEVIQYIQRVIKDKFDVQLETEVRIIGEEKE